MRISDWSSDVCSSDLLPAAARAKGIEVLAGHGIVATKGAKQVTGVSVAPLNAASDALSGTPRDIACDLVCMSGGWNPTVHLFSQAIGKLRFDDAIAAFVPDKWIQKLRNAGACDGRFALADCLAQGRAERVRGGKEGGGKGKYRR